MKYLLVLFCLSCSCQAKTAKTNDATIKDTETIQITSTNDTTDSTQINSKVWVKIILSEQRMYLYENGNFVDTFKVTTGNRKHKTPLMDRRPSGPIYLKYTSKKFPGGDYMGLGNMPYVVFIRGGYAIHGTTPGNFNLLGKTGSHGCIRLHPTHAEIFYNMVQKYSLEQTWITIKN